MTAPPSEAIAPRRPGRTIDALVEKVLTEEVAKQADPDDKKPLAGRAKDLLDLVKQQGITPEMLTLVDRLDTGAGGFSELERLVLSTPDVFAAMVLRALAVAPRPDAIKPLTEQINKSAGSLRTELGKGVKSLGNIDTTTSSLGKELEALKKQLAAISAAVEKLGERRPAGGAAEPGVLQ